MNTTRYTIHLEVSVSGPDDAEWEDVARAVQRSIVCNIDRQVGLDDRFAVRTVKIDTTEEL